MTQTTLKRGEQPSDAPVATWQLNPDIERLKTLGPLTADQIKQYYEEGFLLIENFYSKEEMDSVQKAVEDQLDDLAKKLFASGKIEDLYEGLDWTKRLLAMSKDFPDATIIFHKSGVLPEAIYKVFTKEKLQEIAQQLGCSPDLCLSPIWNLRAKLPSHAETVVPWHQDNSYIEPRLWNEHVLAVWVAFVDATPENGCMEYVHKGHLSGKTAKHTIGSTTTTWYTEMSEEVTAKDLLGRSDGKFKSGDVETVPCKRGSIILFPGTTPHRSINSTSDRIRWSADFRFHRRKAERQGKSDLDWFFGMKEALPLRDGTTPIENPDWKAWASIERTTLQDTDKGIDTETSKKEFDPIIVGPWMDVWDIEQHEKDLPNKHTDRYLATLKETPVS